MNVSNSELRARARAALGGGIFAKKWLMAIVVCLIYSAIVDLISSVTMGFGELIVVGPLTVGMSVIFINLVRTSNDVEIEDMFIGVKNNFLDHFMLGFMQAIFVFLWSLLFIVPGIIKTYSYSMSYYIKNDHPEYTWKECIDESRRIMDGHKMELFLLDFSFIGWIIVGILTCGVGLFWVTPYMTAAHAAFYDELIQS